jgi:hypothetical protein
MSINTILLTEAADQRELAANFLRRAAAATSESDCDVYLGLHAECIKNAEGFEAAAA